MPFTLRAALVALSRMFDDRSFFSVSTVRDLWDMLDVQPDPKLYIALRQFHCVHWCHLSETARMEVKKAVAESLGWSLDEKGDFMVPQHLLTA